MEVQNRRKNAERHLFSMWSHHCLTRYGGLPAAAEAGEMPREALFSDPKIVATRRAVAVNDDPLDLRRLAVQRQREHVRALEHVRDAALLLPVQQVGRRDDILRRTRSGCRPR